MIPLMALPVKLEVDTAGPVGIVDVLEETWDAQARTLSGLSKVVGDDPYELRILSPVGEKSWRATRVEVDGAENVQSELSQNGPGIRVQLDSSINKKIR